MRRGVKPSSENNKDVQWGRVGDGVYNEEKTDSGVYKAVFEASI